MAEARTCPACGAPMDFRLGEYQCTRCDQTVSAQPEQPKLKSTVQWGPGAQLGPAPPPPGQLTQYSGQYDYRNPDTLDSGDPLRTEKMLYLGAALLNNIFSSYLAFSNPQTAALFGGFDAGTLIGFGIVGALIGLGLNALVLFLPEVWLKWTCISCTGCGMLGLLGSLLGLGAMAAGAGQGNPITNVIAVGMGSWLIWILWRDIQNKQGGYS